MDVFNQIINAQYSFPDHFSAEAKDLISKLLNKNPLKSLGFGPKGYEKLKKHDFFKEINFDDLANAL